MEKACGGEKQVVVVEQELERKLKQLRVRVDVPDGDTVLLRNVPANGRFFNKPRTNVLIKRPRAGMPYLICVDEDLDYNGSDLALARAFAAGQKQQGWRVLSVGHWAQSGIQELIEEALGAVGFDGREPQLAPRPSAETTNATTGKLLAGYSIAVSCDEGHEPTIGREERIEEVVSSLLQWQARLPLIAGEPGVGKTNLIRAVARSLKQCRPAWRVLSIELSEVMAGSLFDSDRESLLIALLKEATDDRNAVLVLEHLEMAVLGVPRGHLLLCHALDRGARLIGTTLPGHLTRFDVAPLCRRVQVSELPEMGISETSEVLLALRDQIAEHHAITMSDGVLDVAIETSLGLAGHLPAKAIALLDAAAARASMSGEREVEPFYVLAAAEKSRAVIEY